MRTETRRAVRLRRDRAVGVSAGGRTASIHCRPGQTAARHRVQTRGEDFRTVGDFTVREGEEASFVLNWSPSFRAAPPPLSGEELAEAREQVHSFWTGWAAAFKSADHWGDAVLRSLLTLKALAHWETGGIVAAATTSLPEQLGGPRNWDYRYCWLRDATFTLYALIGAGILDEAKAWHEWLLRAVAGSPDDLQIVYGVAGERRLEEYELPWLPGYEGSTPVRIGNGAVRQLQLDVYGEVLDAFYVARRAGLSTSDATWALECALLLHLENIWREPDEGIWEVRGGPRHFTHSKVMAWVAFDRAVRSIEEFGLDGPLERWREVRSAIHAEVCEHGYDAKQNAFVQSFGDSTLDASLLLVPIVGFLPPDDPRVQGTVAAIERKLLRDGFVLRYDTGTAKWTACRPARAPFSPAASGWSTITCFSGGMTRRARCSSACCACATTSGCWRRNTIPMSAASLATSLRPFRISRSSTRRIASAPGRARLACARRNLSPFKRTKQRARLVDVAGPRRANLTGLAVAKKSRARLRSSVYFTSTCNC